MHLQARLVGYEWLEALTYKIGNGSSPPVACKEQVMGLRHCSKAFFKALSKIFNAHALLCRLGHGSQHEGKQILGTMSKLSTDQQGISVLSDIANSFGNADWHFFG